MQYEKHVKLLSAKNPTNPFFAVGEDFEDNAASLYSTLNTDAQEVTGKTIPQSVQLQ
jgi:hypothetical protein